MSYTIAIAGKGGSGKTTVASLLVRLLKENKKGSVLAIDADPNSNLAQGLGLETEETIGSIIDDIAQNPDKIPAGMTKERFMEYQVQSAVSEGEGFDVLSMGNPEGPGCYCYANNVLRNVMAKLSGDYDYVVVDNEAGLEHLSRRTTRRADVLLVVSEATAVGLRTAKKIKELAGELKIDTGKSFLLLNRNDGDIEKDRLQAVGLDYLGSIPVDQQITELSANGNSLWGLNENSPSMNVLRKLGEKIWQRN